MVCHRSQFSNLVVLTSDLEEWNVSDKDEDIFYFVFLSLGRDYFKNSLEVGPVRAVDLAPDGFIAQFVKVFCIFSSFRF